MPYLALLGASFILEGIMGKTRKGIPKKIRFEVFKRDLFKCQYCGSEAPEVVLQIDHINPVFNGGGNDITNLITACFACNIGKGKIKLEDHTVISKSRQQMEHLQERREQLEMIMSWRKGLNNLGEKALTHLCDYWNDLLPGWGFNENGKQILKKLLKKFTQTEIIEAMDVSVLNYIKYKGDEIDRDSIETATNKLGGICYINRSKKEDPDISENYYIRGILKNRLNYFDSRKALSYIKEAREFSATTEQLKEIATTSKTWTDFRCKIEALINE